MDVELILVGVVVAAVVSLAWHLLGDKTDDPETMRLALAAAQEREKKRLHRMVELRRAYKVAKEELGEEPTVDQIFLTRDALRTQDLLENDGTS